MGETLGGALAELGADLRGDLGFHQLGGHPRRAVAQHVGVLVNQQLVGELGGGHPGPVGHRGGPFVALRKQTTILRRCGGRTHIGPPALLHHSPRRDRT
ncbi:MAG TPA: hypothetical protein VFN05_19150, partial [Actinomycetes bacterium]|nr:hypothetical protein [Actinomycetes bacterium]